MSWTLLLGVVLVLGFSLLVTMQRRAELARMRTAVTDRDEAVQRGTHDAKLLHPVVDLSRCLGCATCVAVCPEDGVLEIVHGQAVVVKGSACQGISACERECPAGAIAVTIANLEERDDVPVIGEELEAGGTDGIYLAGEVTAHALIKPAIEQGTRVARAVAHGRRRSSSEDVLDLLIVGAGPAGLACALEGKELGLRTLLVDQEPAIGGTVAKYPRAKLVMTEPVELPRHGRLKQLTYSKEELMELWNEITQEAELAFHGGERFVGVEQADDGVLWAQTDKGSYATRNICIAVGRRGSPRKLEVPGEDLPHVAYSLMDASKTTNRSVLVVGGGDSAVETALGLAEQPGNEVMLSYRQEEFVRVRSRNMERLDAARTAGSVSIVTRSNVHAIAQGSAELEVATAHGTELVTVPADEVYVMAGGVAPFQLLRELGVSFDHTGREATAPLEEQGTGFVRALWAGFVMSLAALIFALWHFDYYSLPTVERPAHPKHTFLRPGMGYGLGLGIASVAMILFNLLYLVRRSTYFRLRVGTLRTWMTSHVATGILAVLLATLHAAMAPRDTVGGHAFWSLVFLLVTGAIGRYFYAYVPRAANGRELELAEVKNLIEADFEGGSKKERTFGRRARKAVTALVERRQWRASFFGRLLSLVGMQFDLSRVMRKLTAEGKANGIDDAKIRRVLRLARRAYRTALNAAHFEDLRGILGTWRYLHRWVAALMVLLVILHIFSALTYGEFFFEGGAG